MYFLFNWGINKISEKLFKHSSDTVYKFFRGFEILFSKIGSKNRTIDILWGTERRLHS